MFKFRPEKLQDLDPKLWGIIHWAVQRRHKNEGKKHVIGSQATQKKSQSNSELMRLRYFNHLGNFWNSMSPWLVNPHFFHI